MAKMESAALPDIPLGLARRGECVACVHPEVVACAHCGDPAVKLWRDDEGFCVWGPTTEDERWLDCPCPVLRERGSFEDALLHYLVGGCDLCDEWGRRVEGDLFERDEGVLAWQEYRSRCEELRCVISCAASPTATSVDRLAGEIAEASSVFGGPPVQRRTR